MKGVHLALDDLSPIAPAEHLPLTLRSNARLHHVNAKIVQDRSELTPTVWRTRYSIRVTLDDRSVGKHKTI